LWYLLDNLVGLGPGLVEVLEDVVVHQLTLVDVKLHPVHIQEEIASHEGVGGNVSPPDVQEPGDLVQRRHHHGVHVEPAQPPSHLLHFLGPRLAGVLLLQNEDVLVASGRSPGGPHHVDQVGLHLDKSPVGAAELVAQLVPPVLSYEFGVGAEHSPAGVDLVQPLSQRGNPHEVLAHQSPMAVDLVVGLEVVPAVGPEHGGVVGDDGVAVAAAEAGDVLQALIVVFDEFVLELNKKVTFGPEPVLILSFLSSGTFFALSHLFIIFKDYNTRTKRQKQLTERFILKVV
jgi:hypothetical protein